MKILSALCLTSSLALGSPLNSINEGVNDNALVERSAYVVTSDRISIGNTSVSVVAYIQVDYDTGKIVGRGIQNIFGTPYQFSWTAYYSDNNYKCNFVVDCYNTAGTIHGRREFSMSSPGPM